MPQCDGISPAMVMNQTFPINNKEEKGKNKETN